MAKLVKKKRNKRKKLEDIKLSRRSKRKISTKQKMARKKNIMIARKYRKK